MKRPLFVVGLSYFAALAVACLAGQNVAVALAIGCALCAFFALCRSAFRKYISVIAALLSATAAFSLFAVKETLSYLPAAEQDGQVVTVEAEVLSEEATDSSARCYRIEVRSGDLPQGTRLNLWISNEEFALEPYDVFSGTLSLSVRGAAGQELTLSNSSKADGVYLNAFPEGYMPDLEIHVRAADPPFWRMALDAMRSYVYSVPLEFLDGDPAALTDSVGFGFKQDLSEAVETAFRRSGVSHLMAVSGLHISMVAMGALGLLQMLRVRRRWAALCAMPVVLLFMAITGFQPSVIRAGVMNLILLLALAVGREADSLNSLGMSVLCIVVPNPYAVLDVGLQLSFAATLGLLLFYPWLQDKLTKALKLDRDHPKWRWLRPVVSSVCVSLAATVAVLPVSVLTFQELSLMNLLANLLTVYPAMLLVVCACIGVLLSLASFLFPFTSGAFFLSGLLARYLLAVTGCLGGFRYAMVDMRNPYLVLWVFGSLVLLLCGWRWLRGKGLRQAAALSVATLCVGLTLNLLFMRNVTTITALSSYGGMALLLQRDGHSAMIVAGDSSSMSAACNEAKYHNILALDFVLVVQPEEMKSAGYDRLDQKVEVGMWLTTPRERTGGALDARLLSASTLTDDNTLTFWNDGKVEYRSDGFLRVSLGDTRILICPAAGDTAALPASWRNTHLAVFQETAPKHASAIRAQQGFLFCDEETLPYAGKTVPWGVYPITIPTQTGDMALMTRGSGDLSLTLWEREGLTVWP